MEIRLVKKYFKDIAYEEGDLRSHALFAGVYNSQNRLLTVWLESTVLGKHAPLIPARRLGRVLLGLRDHHLRLLRTDHRPRLRRRRRQ